jgi:hypothetical protein
MRGGLPHRPGYAVVPELEPGAVRRAMALRGKHASSRRPADCSFDVSRASHPKAGAAARVAAVGQPQPRGQGRWRDRLRN